MNSVKLEMIGSVAKIAINRPEFMNSLNNNVATEIISSLKKIKRRKEIKAVIFTGIGDYAFSSGADFQYIQKNLSLDKMKDIYNDLGDLFNEIDNFNRITIASINGACLAGGFILAAVCDLRISSDKAIFGMPEIKFGMFPTYSSIPRIIQLVGFSSAQQIFLEGESFSAEKAKEIGFIHEIVSHEKLKEMTFILANKIAENSPLVSREVKKTIIKLKKGEIHNYEEYEKGIFEKCWASEEFREGVHAIVEKRKPKFE